MFTKDAVAFFGSKTVIAEKLGIHKSAVTNWKEVVPKGRAFELEKLTKGKLKVDPALYQKSQNAA